MSSKPLLIAIILVLLSHPVPATANQNWAWPVPYGTLTSSPGWRLDPFTKKRWTWHNGYDIAVPTGTPVQPTAPGTVVYSDWYRGYGWLVVVDHGSGVYSMYGHNSRLLAPLGASVKQGDTIALSGSTGRSTGPHIHFEYRVVQQQGSPYPQEETEEAPSQNFQAQGNISTPDTNLQVQLGQGDGQ